MQRLHVLSWSGLALFSAVVFSTAARPILHAQGPPGVVSSNEVTRRFDGIGPFDEQVSYVRMAPKPMTVAETKVWLKLQEKVALAFPNETPLDELIKFVRKSTADHAEFPDGVPIYVDPQGLQDADKTLQSPIQIDLKGIPLATTLKLALKQLGLCYWVNADGLLIITCFATEDEIPGDRDEMILKELERLDRNVSQLRNEFRMLNGLNPLFGRPPTAPDQQPAMKTPGGMM